MKNNLRILIAAVLFAIAGLYLHTSRQEDFYQQKALLAIDNILIEISDWQQNSMEKHLSAQTKASISQQQMNTLLESYRHLGKYHKTRYLEFSKLMSALSLVGGKRISYQGVVEFDSGPTDITITLLEDNNRFFIYNLNIKI